jgi:hypothetical protein
VNLMDRSLPHTQNRIICVPLAEKIDMSTLRAESAFGSPFNGRTQTSSAIIVAVKPSMEYAKLCMDMRLATSAIRHDRASATARSSRSERDKDCSGTFRSASRMLGIRASATTDQPPSATSWLPLPDGKAAACAAPPDGEAWGQAAARVG